MTTTAATDQLLKGREVAKYLGISQGTFYIMLREGRFPSGIRLGPGTVRWKRSDVDLWLEGRRS